MATTGQNQGEAGAVRSMDNSTADGGTSAGARSNDASDFGQDVLNSIQSISQPVEMSDLSTNSLPPVLPVGQAPELARRDPALDGTDLSNHAAPVVDARLSSLTARNEHRSGVLDSGIGPATDKPAAQRTASSGPQLVITLLLHSTETRHPYTIDESYLKRRNVSVAEDNPINMTVYTLKELILRDWRSEWEARPTSPTSIRLIHMGRMLDDKIYLKDCRFSNGDTPHIVHMTIKPQEAIDDEDARIAKGGGRERDGSERSPGCRCVIM